MPRVLARSMRRIARRSALAACVLLCLPRPATAQDLLERAPDDATVIASTPLDRIEVVGSARAVVRGDTLEVITTGSADVALRLAVEPSQAGVLSRVEAVSFVIGASEPLTVQPAVERREGIESAGALQTIAAGPPRPTRVRIEPTVGRRERAAITALQLRLPPFVGRVQIVADVAWHTSAAPRRTVRLDDHTAHARVLGIGATVRWSGIAGGSRRLLADVAAVECFPADGRLELVVEMLRRGELLRTARVEVACAEEGEGGPPWSTLEVGLDGIGDDALELRLSARASADVRAGSIALLAPRVVEVDDPRAPLLLIVVDTLRRDDPGGERADSAPHLHELAGESVRFTHARANSSWTLPSTASMLTGWLPLRHGLGMGEPGRTRLDPAAPTLFERLRVAGWSTAAVSANPVVAPGTGLETGFERFDLRAARDPHERAAEHTLVSALEWLRSRRGTPWALYLHFFDPHDRYQAPSPWRTRFVDPQRRAKDHPTGVWEGRPDPLRDALVEGDRSLPVRRRDVELLAELYRGEVAYVDAMIGALTDSLRAWGEFDRSVVVVTSDHGEEFLEHGMLKHGHALNEELLGVPLTIRAPGLAPRVIDAPASLVDLAPTLATMFGFDPTSGDGRDLGPSMRGQTAPDRPSIAQLLSRVGGAWAGAWTSVVDGPWKWIEGPMGERLFHLEQDPGEFHDLLRAHPDVAARLCAIADSVATAARPASGVFVDEAARLESLRSVGYLR